MSKSILLPILFLLCSADVFGQGYTFDQAVMCGGVVGTYSNQEAAQIPYRVFPNPANQAVSVENLDANASMQCSLFTLDGQLKQLFDIAPQSQFQLITGDLPTGAYILKMQTARQVFTTRLVRL